MTEPCTAVLLFTKTPLSGRVKTRLLAAYGEQQTRCIYQKLLHKTIATATASDEWDSYLWATPTLADPLLESLAAEFAIRLSLQQGMTLGERMLNACKQSLRQYKNTMIVGCDCPALTTADLAQGMSKLNAGYDVVLGPAVDGGYYLIGLREAYAALFADIDWGEATVLSQTRNRIQRMGLSCFELDEKHDLDRPEDYRQLKHLLD